MSAVRTTLLAALISVTGCGGGSGAGDTDGPAPEPGTPPPVTVPAPGPNANVNPVSGRLIYDGARGARVLDLASGEITHWDGWTAAWPSPDGQEIVHLESGVRRGEPERVVITDAEGHVVQSFELSRWVRGYLKLSPDRQRLAGFWADEDNDEFITEPTLTLFGRNGNVIRRLPQATSFAWMPDGRLMLAQGQEIHVADAEGRNPQLLLQTPEAASGLAVSPDGTRLAFVMPGQGTNARNVWVVGLDGSGLRQVTRSSINEVDPQWTADGTTLIVRQGVVTTLEGYAGCPVLYAVPADATLAELTFANEPAVHVLRYLQSSSDTRFRVCPFSATAYLPAGSGASSAGSLPVDDGTLNRGLRGTVFYAADSDDDRKVFRLDLASAAAAQMPGSILDTAASPDGQYFVSAPFVNDDWEANRITINIQDSDGRYVARFTKPGGVRMPIRFSPDGGRLAFQWNDASNEPAGLAVSDWTGNVFAHWTDATAGDWLPDGRLIAAVGSALYLIDATYQQTSFIVDLGAPIDRVRASPDGKSLAVAMSGRIWTVRVDGSQLTLLTVSDGAEGNPEWSPDGRFIALEHLEGDTSPTYAWVVAADAHAARVGSPTRHMQGIPLQSLEGGNTRTTVWARSYFSWR